ncbi:MAG: GNAT family N-acetyltransferase [Anaerolineales bacterium]|nr:GNAT family N-acetyltransferase [Anaerolineales bacterium]
MIELESENYLKVLPLLKNIKQAVLPCAVCEGYNPGRIFVDDEQDPQTAMIWTPVGYYFLVLGQGQKLDEVSNLLTGTFISASKAIGETGFILIAEFDNWREKTSALLNNREVIEIFRRPFKFYTEHFNENWREKIPAGFYLKRVEESLAEQARILGSRKSLDDFISHGIGYALMDGDKLASVCSSVFVSSTRVEIDVHTEEEYRRKGFAVITASALIEECLQQGKQPNWECFWENKESTALALKLGFKQLADYPVYFWEE